MIHGILVFVAWYFAVTTVVKIIAALIDGYKPEPRKPVGKPPKVDPHAWENEYTRDNRYGRGGQ